MTDHQVSAPPAFSQLTAGLPPSAIQFFAAFARCEYALKRGGYLKANGKGRAEATWGELARDLGPRFFNAARAEVRTLIDDPPRSQTVTDAGLSWSMPVQVDDTKTLLDAVKRVRNNLFHGGKFPLEPITEVARNEELLRDALSVLRGILIARPDLSELVFGP